MERSEKLISIWNGEFPEYPLTLPDLKKTHAMMGAYIYLLSRLGIDVDAVLTPPPENERDDHTIYYWDLLPVINMTRVMNHLVRDTALQQEKSPITLPLVITYFLQPDQSKSHSLLLLLVNMFAFNESRLKDIEPCVSELFRKRDQVKQLEERKNRVLGALNEQAEEKGKRAHRIERLDHDIKQFEEELKLEKESHVEEKQELEAALEELRQRDLILEQKRTQRDALMAEVAKKRAVRVYDAEDIQAQAEQAAQNVKEAEEKLESLKATLMQKETCLQNLQKNKPNLEQANVLLCEVKKRTECLNEYETGDLETDTNDGELELLNTEASKLQSQLGEQRAARREFDAKKAENQARRQLLRAQLQSALREAEGQDMRFQKKSKKSLQITKEIKEMTIVCEQDKQRCVAELEALKQQYITELKSFEDESFKKLVETRSAIEKILQRRHS